jgi:hypothetical protein
MQVELKQGVFRFLLLSHINELMMNKELIINTIRKATINANVARSVQEVEDGAIANTKPILKKEIKQILRDLNAFALSGGDAKRNAASDSTSTSEVSVSNDTVDIKNQTFMLEAAWGFLGEDLEGNTLSDELETAFQSYIEIVREIASWVMYLSTSKSEAVVQVGASTLSTLLSKWGPTNLDGDLSDFYNQLFEHVYVYSMNGEVVQLLDSTPVGISIKVGTKEDVKFDDTGRVNIKLPMPVVGSQNTGERYYLTNVDYIDAIDDCGKPEIEVATESEKCSDVFTIQLKSIDGIPICEKEERVAATLGSPKQFDPPPSFGVYEPLPVMPTVVEADCCAPPVLLLPLIGCTPQDDNNDAVQSGMKLGMSDYIAKKMRLAGDVQSCSAVPMSDCTLVFKASNHTVYSEEKCTEVDVAAAQANPGSLMGSLDCAFR